MNRKHREKIDLLIKFLKREPREVDMAPKRKGYLSFDTKDIYKKYCMLDKHIKLVDAFGWIKKSYHINTHVQAPGGSKK